MKKILFTVLIIFIASSITVLARDSYVIKSGISMVNSVPKQFFGTWEVTSYLKSANYEKTFKQKGFDLWNLRRSGNVIELSNPVTGAVAEVYLSEVNGNVISFSHVQKEDNLKLTDTVKIELNENSFTGTNEISIEYLKANRNDILQEPKIAKYEIKGKKVFGNNIFLEESINGKKGF